jgi:hypothetical protein
MNIDREDVLWLWVVDVSIQNTMSPEVGTHTCLGAECVV